MLAVIGCGNAARSDDAAGVEVLQRLRARIGSADDRLQLIDAGTAGMEVMFKVRGADRVIIVDACRSGSEPGAVFRVPGSEIQTPTQHSFTLHGLRWDHALYAGCQMYGKNFLRDVEVFLIEVQSIDFGLGLSEPVERGVERVVSEIEQLLGEHVGTA